MKLWNDKLRWCDTHSLSLSRALPWDSILLSLLHSWLRRCVGVGCHITLKVFAIAISQSQQWSKKKANENEIYFRVVGIESIYPLTGSYELILPENQFIHELKASSFEQTLCKNREESFPARNIIIHITFQGIQNDEWVQIRRINIFRKLYFLAYFFFHELQRFFFSYTQTNTKQIFLKAELIEKLKVLKMENKSVKHVRGMENEIAVLRKCELWNGTHTLRSRPLKNFKQRWL